MIRWAQDPGPEPHVSKRDLAESAGFDPGEDYNQPPPEHLRAPDGVNPFAWFVTDIRALRIVGPLTRCAHPHCRTHVTEDDVSFCPHNLPFCEACAFADGCPECAPTSRKAS